MKITTAFNELQSVREELARGLVDHDVLLARVDAVGGWAAGQKYTAKIHQVLAECHQLADRIGGGSGKGGVRIAVA